MKLIIAGGRNYSFTQEDCNFLDSVINITEVVSGGARGADKCGEIYATMRKIPTKRFTPDWNQYGKAAAHIRNNDMAKYADAVVLFPGGKGTESMFKAAQRHGIDICDRREN